MFKIISPIDGSVLAERRPATQQDIDHALHQAQHAFGEWRLTPVSTRAAICSLAVDWMVNHTDSLAEEITRQMGRPIAHSPGEIRGFEERARHMIDIAGEALADLRPAQKPGFERFVRKEPLGTILTVAPWNYPYLTAVNSIIPALMAGNSVILKHSAQTLLCGERMEEAFAAAGAPPGLFKCLHLEHEDAARLIKEPSVAMVVFTGSVEGGAAVEEATSGQFMRTAFELGGKDPAYVCEDADLDDAIAQLADGAFFNAGQSCCGIERIYVAEKLFEPFVEGVVAAANALRLGDPLDPSTTLGPMVNAAAAEKVREQVLEARKRGAVARVDASLFEMDEAGSAYHGPQVLTEVDHKMALMTEETFGPVVGIMPVRSDDDAIALMNDSRYGLTASVWTSDQERAIRIGESLETGTVFMNRCDYLDPALAWSGVKMSGQGVALSQLGYDQFTRPKSYHLKLQA